jgi:hypothetical protein
MVGIVWQNRSVRQLCELGRDVQISHGIVGIDDHDGTWQDVRTFEEQPMGLPEVAATIIGEKCHIGDFGLLGEAFWWKGCRC